jgi:hypothetical protein
MTDGSASLLQNDPQEAQILAEIEQWADTEGWK